MKKKKIVFQVRPWDAGLYLNLERYLREHAGMPLSFDYLTHNFQVESDLRKKGRDCINVVREIRKIPFPPDWRLRLSEIEENSLGITRNFFQYLAAERMLWNKPQKVQLRQLYRMVVFYCSYFEKSSPHLLLSNGPDHMATWLSMDLVRVYGGTACGFVPTSWPRNHFSMFREVGRIHFGPELFADLLKRGLTGAERDEALEHQRRFMKGRAVPINVSSERHALVKKRSPISRVKSRLRSFYWQCIERFRGSWYILAIPFPGRHLLRGVVEKLRQLKISRYFREDVPSDIPFVFFPLHLEPESTTNVFSIFYDNQLEIIRTLSKALPARWLLAIKEHPNMKNSRAKGFYRTLQRLPNTLLVRPDEPGWKLVRACQLVATLSGTSGLEAAIIGKPVLVFGDPVWGYAPTAHKVGALHKLNLALLETVNVGLDREDERVLAFILSWVHANPEGIHDYFPWLPPVDSPENVERIGSAVVRLLHDIDENLLDPQD
jgi:hypothetical protein